MSNALIPSGDDDGFSNVPLSGRGAIRGATLTYNAVDDNYWKDRVDVVNGESFAVLGARRGWQFWPLDGSPPQYLLDEPGAPHPNRDAFGHQDKSEWLDGINGPSDPYREIWILFLASPETGAEATFVSATAGGAVAVEVLVEEIRKRRRREPDAYPVIRLEATSWKTKYGLKRRPHFAVTGWVYPGGERASASAPEPPTPLPAAAPPIPGGKITITSGKGKAKTKAAIDPNLDDGIPF